MYKKFWFFILYLTESLEVRTGTTALFLFRLFVIFLSKLIEKFGLAASWMNTFFGLYFHCYIILIGVGNEKLQDQRLRVAHTENV